MKFLLLVFFALSVSSKATVVTTDSNLDLIPTKLHGAGVNRMLRAANSGIEEGEEERKVNIPGMSTIAAKIGMGAKVSEKIVQKRPGNTAFMLFKGNLLPADKLLASKRFSRWYTYMSLVYRKDPEAAMITTLTAHYSDDALTKMIAAALKVPETRNMAKKLRMAHWLSTNKPAGDAFVLLKLDKGVDKMLASSKLDIFLDYVERLNMKNPGKKESPIDIMTFSFGDEVLAKALEAAKHVDRNERATKLQNAQFKMWFEQGAKQHQIWKMLKMDKKTWTTNPDAQVWYGYKAFIKQQNLLATSKN